MKSIWKYPVKIESEFSILIPKGGKVLSVDVQNGKPVFWVIVDPNEEKKSRVFRVYGSGHLHEDIKGRYIGSFQLQVGTFVGHLFEEVDDVTFGFYAPDGSIPREMTVKWAYIGERLDDDNA